MTSNQPKTFGEAQWRFIQKIRKAIDAKGKAYFDGREWRRICPEGGTYDSKLLCHSSKRKWTVDSFNIKAVAVFVPHLMKEGPCSLLPALQKEPLSGCEESTVDQLPKGPLWNSHAPIPGYDVVLLSRLYSAFRGLSQGFNTTLSKSMVWLF